MRTLSSRLFRNTDAMPTTWKSRASRCSTCRGRPEPEIRRPSATELTIRPARRDDLPRLVEIYNHYVEQSVSTFDTRPTSVDDRLAWFEAFSETGPYRLFVASDGDRVLGCASSSPYRSHPAFAKTVEVGVYLDPAFLGQGIGSALYAVLFDALLHEDIHDALAGIALPNDASVALHRKFGFTEVGVFHEYAIKNSRYIDSLWMERRF